MHNEGKFYIEIFRAGGGTIDGYHVLADSAQVAAEAEAERWKKNPEAVEVEARASDRKSGTATVSIPRP